MARRGSLDWNLETIGKLLLGVIIIVFLVWMTMKILDLWAGGTQEAQAQHSFEMLRDRIEQVKKAGLKPPEASVILTLPTGYMLVGFSAGVDKIQVDYVVSNRNITRPRSCDNSKACLCLMTEFKQSYDKSTAPVISSPITCESLGFKSVVGTLGTQKSSTDGEGDITVILQKQSGHYDFVLSSTPGTPFVADVKILPQGDTLVLDASPPSSS
jgi:hypothetical protein